MKILHLTDFHYRSDSSSIADQNKLIECLCNTLSDEKIDLIFFTGDLVNKGNELKDFIDANESFLVKVSKSLEVDFSNVFICAGNHDVYRGQELQAIKSEFDRIETSEALEVFIKSQNGKQFEASLLNLKNYLEFQGLFYEKHKVGSEPPTVKELYSIHKRIVDNKRVAIATINTAWRSHKSETDRGNLFFPVSTIKDIISDLSKNVDFKILLLHHPISDLKVWNASEVEDLIHNGFHMMFSGHVHKRKNGTYITNDEGIFCSVAPATLSLYENDSKIGISIFDVDLETYQVEIDNKIYDKNENAFYHQKDKQKSEIPLQGIKRDQNEFRKKLRGIYGDEVVRANDLFISSNETAISRTFLELFTTPILKEKSKAEIANKHEFVPNIPLESIIQSNNNYVIYGKDKSGKTSLLYKILLDLLHNYTTNRIIPYYLDAFKYKSNPQNIDFTSLLARYFQISKGKLEEYTKKYHFKILIDNFDPGNELFNSQLSSYLESHPNISFVFTTYETIKRPFEDLGLGDYNYSNIYIHEISRNEIRTLTNKWPSIPKDKKEIILDKITQIFQQLNMPMNYWTVSLFLWIFEKTNEANFHNNFELIQLYIDNLLDRRRLVLDKSLKIDYEDFKTFLGELAYELINKHIEHTYTVDYTQLINFTNNYRDRNKRFVIPVEDVINLVINKGILKKTSDDRYTFRLNGVFEYFLAFYMKDNPEFRDAVIKDSHHYLSFSNEFELYSGFNKRDKNFLKEIFLRTKDIFEPITDAYNGGKSKDDILTEKVSEVFDITIPIKQLAKSKTSVLAPEKQDALIEEFNPVSNYKEEVQEKKFYDKIDLTAENLEKTLFILSRVFRNSSINDDIFNNEVLDFILDSACNLGFLLIDEANPVDLESQKAVLHEEDDKLLMKIMTNFMPLLVETFLFDALAQNNLERIFLGKIEELKKDKESNQFKLLILYFLLIDLDVRGNKKYIDELIENINLDILKQTTLVKLYTYLMFKSHNLPEFEQYLRNQIQKQTLKISKESDLGSIHRGFSNTKKIVLFKNRKRK